MSFIPSPWREIVGGIVLLLTLAVSHWFPMGFAPSYMDAPAKKRAEGIQTLQLNQPAASASKTGLL